MSYELGTKVKLVTAWRAYSAGAVLEQGFEADLEQLVRMGVAVRIDEAAARPAKLSTRAAKTIADGMKKLL